MAVPDGLSDWAASEEWDAFTPRRPSWSNPPRARRDTRAEARRRMRLIRRRRLDLLQDGLLALILAVIVLTVSAGLAVVALLAAPAGLVLVASLIVERRRRRPSRSS